MALSVEFGLGFGFVVGPVGCVCLFSFLLILELALRKEDTR